MPTSECGFAETVLRGGWNHEQRLGLVRYEVLFGTDGKYDGIYFPERVSETFWKY